MTSSPQALQSSIATDGNVSIDSIITKPSLTSSRLQSDSTSCGSGDNTPDPSHEDHPLLNDSRVTANSDDLLKSEMPSEKVQYMPCNVNLKVNCFIVEINDRKAVRRVGHSSKC